MPKQTADKELKKKRRTQLRKIVKIIAKKFQMQQIKMPAQKQRKK